jgi:hypothetical protein
VGQAERRAAIERARIGPRLWVLSLLYRHQTTLELLNRQLLHVPDGRAYVAGVHPEPAPADGTIEDKFSRHLERGTSPDGDYYGGDQPRFNLAKRVQEFDPDSYPWLLNGLLPYLKVELPSIDSAVDTLAQTLNTLRLRRISWSAAWFGSWYCGESYWTMVKRQLDYYATLPTPHHLTMLVCLWHERLWAAPFSGAWQPKHDRYLALLSDAWDTAIVRLSKHPMLDVHPIGRSVGRDIQTALEFVRRNLSWFAMRSVISPSKEPEPVIVPSLFVRDFEGFEDADFCAGLGAGIPIEQVEGLEPPRLTRYSNEPVPPPEAYAEAFEDLLAHFDPPEIREQLDAVEFSEANEHVWRRFGRCE